MDFEESSMSWYLESSACFAVDSNSSKIFSTVASGMVSISVFMESLSIASTIDFKLDGMMAMIRMAIVNLWFE